MSNGGAAAATTAATMSEMVGKLNAKRRKLSPISTPQYDFEAVPEAQPDLTGSVVVRVTDRQQWLDSLSEMVLLCNEASMRQAARSGQVRPKAPAEARRKGRVQEGKTGGKGAERRIRVGEAGHMTRGSGDRGRERWVGGWGGRGEKIERESERARGASS